ncbi:DUF4811 domain-containing protein [Lactiplantibacillus garii]|uniref:DUF4811 domain-containing protein n=1 Tax=Lactiplantibacillus garii TaxID=2306423 RepID=A0A3R8J9E4_9LACO|nr:DUF4811 domain-containing protein [Lactiplantibacillus garii]RRK11362.1 DUF4811 domain-containing protein [Lactiplantibacillus garii]
MIIILLILATFVFSGAMIFGHTGFNRSLTILISFIVIAGSLIGLVGNDTAHWGMRQVTTTTISDLEPVKSTDAALMVKHLGTGSEKVIVYRLANATKTHHTVAAANTTIKQTTGTSAQVQVATTRWQYRNHFSKILFSLGTGQPQVSHRQYLFTVPTSWKTVTVKTK